MGGDAASTAAGAVTLGAVTTTGGGSATPFGLSELVLAAIKIATPDTVAKTAAVHASVRRHSCFRRLLTVSASCISWLVDQVSCPVCDGSSGNRSRNIP